MAVLSRSIPWNWAQGVDVYQLNAGTSHSPKGLVSMSVGEFARRTRGTPHWMLAPTVAPSLLARDTIVNGRDVSQTMRQAHNAEVMAYSPGSVTPDSLMLRFGYLLPQELPELLDSGASADILSHFVCRDGTPASADLDARTVSYPLTSLIAGRKVLAVGCGLSKVNAFRTVLSGRLASAVVTDSDTARSILDLM